MSVVERCRSSQRGLRFNKLHTFLCLYIFPSLLSREREKGAMWELFRCAGHAPEIHTLNDGGVDT